MKKLVLLSLALSSVGAFSASEYVCKNSNKKINLSLSNPNLVLKMSDNKSLTLRYSKSTSRGFNIYKSEQSKAKLKFDRGLKKVIVKLNSKSLKKETFVDCKKIVKVDPVKVEPAKAEVSTELEVTSLPKVISTKGEHKIFTKYGQLAQIKYKPINSPVSFKYDVLYYIPKSLKGKKGLKTLVFLHGGGASTSDRAGSLSVVRSYSSDLIQIANKLGVVLVLPSGSGINWGSHMLSYLRDLNTTLRQDLDLDPNGIALSGHSMGGMGITRTGYWLTDDYSFFLPVAAGLDSKNLTESNMRPYFNMTYHHLQGLRDHFGVFVTRSKQQEAFIKKMEVKYGKKSGFTMEFYNGSHNYPLTRYTQLLKSLFKTSSRNLYQKELHGKLYFRDEVLNNQWSNGNDFYLAPRNTYFWLKATDFREELKVIDVDAKIQNNKISIKIGEGVKTLRVYLSSKMMNLSKEVEINVNGINKFKNIPTLDQDLSQEIKKDPGFKFDGYIDLTI